MLIEDPYTDRDFLDDYTAYYATCYTSFERRCKRAHFFKRSITDSELRALITAPLSEDDKEALNDDYLGFVVARPLPETVIGRTVLKTRSGGGRSYPTVRRYEVNLFGIELGVEGLAFQEQDTVLAACATVALWSAFHKTGDLFRTTTPTPAVITRAATQTVHFGRPIPSHGLRVEELCSAIRHVGLDPEVVDLTRTEDVPLVSLLYGYLRMGLPVILVVDIRGRGWHAITLNGYSCNSTPWPGPEVVGSDVVPMMGLRIDEFYGHDDQIGPHAPLVVERSLLVPEVRFRSLWTDVRKENIVFPVAVVVPVYNKIRLTFLDLQKWIAPLDVVLSGIGPGGRRVEWDVHLILSNEFKGELRSDSQLDREIRENLLLTHQPRFWWRAVMRLDGLALCELLFDATGIARSFPLSAIVWRVEGFALAVEKALDDPIKRDFLLNALRSEEFVEFLRESIECRRTPGDLILRMASLR